mmetsp:Transcript_40805/g.105880  ORF Transcript_40805/g.105880 Transcript_40805/m.105880 type:complete len:89 (-) Transcript_40805:2471-2737(-)
MSWVILWIACVLYEYVRDHIEEISQKDTGVGKKKKKRSKCDTPPLFDGSETYVLLSPKQSFFAHILFDFQLILVVGSVSPSSPSFHRR